MNLTRTSWVKLNRMRTDFERFGLSMYKWGLASSAKCKCGASEKTADQIISTCPENRAPRGIMGLTILDDETKCWLDSSLPVSDLGNTASWDGKRINSRSPSFSCV